jgi:hypothetical protein
MTATNFEMADVIYVSTNCGSPVVAEDETIYALDAEVILDCLRKRGRNLENVPVQILKTLETDLEDCDIVYQVVCERPLYLFTNYIRTLIRLNRTLILDAKTLNYMAYLHSHFGAAETSYTITEAKEFESTVV